VRREKNEDLATDVTILCSTSDFNAATHVYIGAFHVRTKTSSNSSACSVLNTTTWPQHLTTQQQWSVYALLALVTFVLVHVAPSFLLSPALQQQPFFRMQLGAEPSLQRFICSLKHDFGKCSL